MLESHFLIWLKILMKTCRYIKKHITRYDKLSIIQNSIFAIEYKCIKKTDIYYIHNYNRGGKNIMKKSTILSLATAGAIVATSAFTFAAWDKLEDTATGTVTIRAAADVQATNINTFTETANFGDATNLPSYEGTAKFTLENIPKDLTGYDFKVELDDAKIDTTSVKDNVDVKFVDNFTAADNGLNGEHDVTVTITPKDEAAKATLSGKELNVTIKGSVAKTSESN